MAEPNIDADDPLSRLDGVAVELHEMFKALQKAGFTHSEAIQIVSYAVSDGVMSPAYSSHFVEYDDSDEDLDDDDGDSLLG